MPSYSAIQLLESLDGGRFVGDLTGELNRVVKGVITARSSGQVTITLNVASAENDSADITPALRSKINDTGRRPTQIWANKFGGFSNENPQQGALINVELLTPHVSKPAG